MKILCKIYSLFEIYAEHKFDKMNCSFCKTKTKLLTKIGNRVCQFLLIEHRQGTIAKTINRAKLQTHTKGN